MSKTKSKDLSREELFEQVIKIAIDNGLYITGRKAFKAELKLKNQVIVYFNDELDTKYKVINFTEFVTSKEFIEAIARYCFNTKNKGLYFPSDYETTLKNNKEFGYFYENITALQAVAIRDNKLEEFYRQII